jgi:hypothetical protein
MRLPRMTTRRWMIAVAAAGVMLSQIAHVRLKQRQRAFLALTTAHAQKVVAIRERKVDLDHAARDIASFLDERRTVQLTIVGLGATGLPGPSSLEIVKAELSRQQRESDRLARSIDYYISLKRKYERAAIYPWLPVEPDPPEPK